MRTSANCCKLEVMLCSPWWVISSEHSSWYWKVQESKFRTWQLADSRNRVSSREFYTWQPAYIRLEPAPEMETLLTRAHTWVNSALEWQSNYWWFIRVNQSERNQKSKNKICSNMAMFSCLKTCRPCASGCQDKLCRVRACVCELWQKKASQCQRAVMHQERLNVSTSNTKVRSFSWTRCQGSMRKCRYVKTWHALLFNIVSLFTQSVSNC